MMFRLPLYLALKDVLKGILSRYLEQIALSRSLADIYGCGNGGLGTFYYALTIS